MHGSRIEKFSSVIWALLTLTICLVDGFIFRRTLSSTERFYERLIVHVLFLNFTHIFFTYTMLFCVPEVKNFVKETIKTRVLLSASSVLIFSFAFYVFYRAGFKQDLAYTQLALLINIILGTQHSLFQARGVALVLWPPRPKLNILADKSLYYLLLLLSITPVFKILFPGFFKLMPSPLIIFGIAAFVAAIIVIKSIQPGVLNSSLVFYSRLFLFPLSLISTFASSFIAINHTQEYLRVFRMVSSNSGMADSQRRRLWLITGGTIVVFSVIYVVLLLYKTPEFSAGLQINEGLRIANALLPAFLVTHYLIDRRLFEMSSVSVRKHVFPLLKNSSSV